MWMWLGEIDKQRPLTVEGYEGKGAELWHEVFKSYYCPSKRITDGKRGLEVTSTKLLDSGEMNHYLMQIEHWCMNEGIKITIPINSDYMELINRQNN